MSGMLLSAGAAISAEELAGKAAGGIHLTSDRWPDTTDMARFARDAARIEGAANPEQEAVAVYRWARKLIYKGRLPHELPAGPRGKTYCADPLKLLNVYGVSHCDGQCRTVEVAWRMLGRRAMKTFMSSAGHTLVHLWWTDEDGVSRWHAFDPMRSCFAYTRDGSRLVGADDICADPSLLVRPSRTTVCTRPPVGLHGWIHCNQYPLPLEHDTSLSLSAGERLKLFWEAEFRPWNFLAWSDPSIEAGLREYGPYDRPAPGRCELVCRPAEPVGDALLAGAGENLSVADGWLRPATEGRARWLYQVRLPYIITDLLVAGEAACPEGAGITVDVSVDDGKTWEPIGRVGDGPFSLAVRADESAITETRKAKQEDPAPPRGRYGYRLRVTMDGAEPAAVGLKGLTVTTGAQLNRLALPRILPGKNVFTVDVDQLTDGLALAVRHTFDDRSGPGRVVSATVEKPPFEYEVFADAAGESEVVSRSIEIRPVAADGRGNRAEGGGDQATVRLDPQAPRDVRMLVGPERPPELRSRGEYEKLLFDADESVARDAAIGLCDLNDPAAAPALVRCLKEYAEQAPVDFAAVALVRLGERAAVPAVLEASKKFPASLALPWALGELGDAQAIPRLHELLAADGRSCWAAAEALGKVGDRSSAERLAAQLAAHRGDDEGASAAKGLLIMARRDQKLAAGAFEALAGAARRSRFSVQRSYAVQAIGVLGDKRAVPALLDALKSRDPEVWGPAARALGQLDSGDDAVLEALRARRELPANSWEAWARQELDGAIEVLSGSSGNSDSTRSDK